MKRECKIKGKHPDEYSELEYIESTGTQCIDTGLHGNMCRGIEFDFVETSVLGSYPSYLSGKLDDFTIANYGGGRTIYLRLRTSEITTSIKKASQRQVFSIMNGVITYNGQTYNYTDGVMANSSNNIFVCNNAALSRYSKVKIYGLAMYGFEDGELVKLREYTPMLRKMDGKPGLYDLRGSICPLTNTPFYVNAGTGEFLYQLKN